MDPARDPDLALQLFGKTPERALLLMRAAWPAAVGPEIARRTELVSLDRGVLQVRVPDATWRRSLWRMRGQLLRHLRHVAGRLAPHSISFVEGTLRIAAAEAPAPPPAPPASTATAPPSVVDAAAAIPDGALRAEFLAVAGRYFGRFGS